VLPGSNNILNLSASSSIKDSTSILLFLNFINPKQAPLGLNQIKTLEYFSKN